MNEQVCHGPTQIHLTFMFSKCATIRMPGEKEVEQNLEFWGLAGSSCTFRAQTASVTLSPAAMRQKVLIVLLQEKNAARALRSREFAQEVWGILEKLVSCSLIIFPLVQITENNIAKQNIRKSNKHCKRWKKGTYSKNVSLFYFFLTL